MNPSTGSSFGTLHEVGSVSGSSWSLGCYLFEAQGYNAETYQFDDVIESLSTGATSNSSWAYSSNETLAYELTAGGSFSLLEAGAQESGEAFAFTDYQLIEGHAQNVTSAARRGDSWIPTCKSSFAVFVAWRSRVC